MKKSQNPFARYLALSALKQVLTDNWSKVPLEEKVNIKNYLINSLSGESIAMQQSKQE
tara:strand:+ start:451 stop:624 length:174 start_codon:yes stop_codon:yes gene_type:complete